jgi:outer membrane protein
MKNPDHSIHRRQRTPGSVITGWVAGVMLLAFCSIGAMAQAVTTMTVSEARDRALKFNRDYLVALQDIDKAQAEVTKARSGALPSLSLSGAYTRNIETPSFFFFEDDGDVTEIKTGADNSFSASLRLTQPLWHGGKVFAAYQIAKEYKEYAQAISDQSLARVLANTDKLFYRTILTRAELDVLQMAEQAAAENYNVVNLMYQEGVVSEYDLLRASVERSSLQPPLIKAESDVQLAEKRLKSFLGMPLDEPLTIVEDQTDTSLANVPASELLLEQALEHRPEMLQAQYLQDMTHKAIRVAKSGYFPSFDAFASYDWQAQSNRFTLKDNDTKSLTAGIQMSFPIFEGGRTRGEVATYTAEHNQARLQALQVRDMIVLEVQSSYDLLIQAKRSLDAQRETIAEAEEGLRIANLRFESGIGTQLEVLSAQVALTSARRSRAQALFEFRAARAELTRVTTTNIEQL